MRLKRKITGVVTACAVAGAVTLGTAAPASAMTQGDYNAVCQWQYQRLGAYAVSGGNAYQWRCYILSKNMGGLDLYGYCVNEMGMNNVQLGDVNDIYSWHCV